MSVVVSRCVCVLTLVEQQMLRDDDLELAAGLRAAAAVGEEVHVADSVLVAW